MGSTSRSIILIKKLHGAGGPTLYQVGCRYANVMRILDSYDSMSNAESGRNAYDAQHADGDAKSRERAAGDRPHMHNASQPSLARNHLAPAAP